MRRGLLYIFLVVLFTLINFYYRPVEGNPLLTKEYKKSNAYINDLYVSDEYFKKNIVSEKYWYIYDEMVEDIKAGKDKDTIQCREEKCINSFYAIYNSLYLDHPEFLMFQGMGAHSKEMEIEPYYYHLNKLQNYFGEKRIEREIDIIKKETKKMSDKEKIIYVYDYVAGHQYDRIFMYSMGNQSAYSFFTKNSSVCAGFAKASQIIFQNIGIKSYPVLSEEHMWNYVEYEGKYYVFDATVGASYVNKKNEHFYEGLGRTTIDQNFGMYQELYPEINETPLQEIFGLKTSKK